jgi:glycosyltransferase involved in cell wall biosynthesis
MLASAYAASSLFVLPSLFETPGIAALEAGLAGSRIAITKYGGTDEYFGQHAEYIEPTRITSIRNAIERALNTEKNDSLQKHIRSKYLWENVAEKTANAYRGLISN